MTNSIMIIVGLSVFTIIMILKQISWAGVSEPVCLISDCSVTIATERAKKMVTVENGLVDFTFFRPDAQRVSVAGDFNDWKTEEAEMKPVGDGNWGCRMSLPAGEYRFRYCADGEWFADYAACGLEPGSFGMDSLIVVSPRRLSVGTVKEPIKIERTFAA